MATTASTYHSYNKKYHNVKFMAQVKTLIRPLKKITYKEFRTLPEEDRLLEEWRYANIYFKKLPTIENPILKKLRAKLKKQKIAFEERQVNHVSIFTTDYDFKDLA